MKIKLQNILKKLKKEEYDIVYEDNKSIIFFPHTQKAASYLSWDTDWALNYGIFSLNSEMRGLKNGFTGLHDFIEINRENNDEKTRYDFLNGIVVIGDYALWFNEKLSKGLKSEKIVRFLFKNYTLKAKEGNLNLFKYPITELNGIEKVEGFLSLIGTQVKTLGDLKYVKDNLFLSKSSIENLGKLQHVGRLIHIQNTLLSKNYDIEYLEEMYPQFKKKFLMF